MTVSDRYAYFLPAALECAVLGLTAEKVFSKFSLDLGNAVGSSCVDKCHWNET